jgi:hypothetical protein
MHVLSVVLRQDVATQSVQAFAALFASWQLTQLLHHVSAHVQSSADWFAHLHACFASLGLVILRTPGGCSQMSEDLVVYCILLLLGRQCAEVCSARE